MFTNLSNPASAIITGNDNIVIIDKFETVRGGRSLDVTGYTPEIIAAGHVVIKETATGNYKPMPLVGGNTAYAALPVGHTYAGVVIASVPTIKAMVGVLLRGTVNSVASPFSVATIAADIMLAVPGLIFRKD